MTVAVSVTIGKLDVKEVSFRGLQVGSPHSRKTAPRIFFTQSTAFKARASGENVRL